MARSKLAGVPSLAGGIDDWVIEEIERGGHMKIISRVAKVLGTDWAQDTFSTFERTGGWIPKEWPCTTADARRIVYGCTDVQLDPGYCERLAQEMNTVAEETWRHLVIRE